MEVNQIIGSIISLIAYIPLIWVVKDKPDSHSWIAFFLYAMFDLITSISIYNVDKQHGWQLPLAYVFGSLYISIFIFIKNKERFKIDGSEIIILFFIIMCGIIWIVSNNRVATITSTIMALLAGLFEAKKLYEKPDPMSSVSWAVFLIGAIIFVLSGQNWDLNSFIEEKLCALTNGLESILFIYVSKKR